MRTAAAILALACARGACAQSAAHPPDFRSASVKRVYRLPEGCNKRLMAGGPGTDSPATLTISAARPIDLLRYAYGVGSDRIRGFDRWSFAWNGTALYQVIAKVPVGATREQIGPMLRRLLERRFHLKAATETRDTEAYRLTVGAGGPKMQAAAGSPAAQPAGARGGKMTLDSRGFPELPPGCYGMGMGGVNGIMRIGARRVDLEDLRGTLSDLLGRPVLDETGLRGRYDFDFEYSMDGLAGPMGGGAGPNRPQIADDAAAARLAASLAGQLNLVLRKDRAPIELVTVEHFDAPPGDR